MRMIRRLALGASLLATTVIAGATGGGSALAQTDAPPVRIGSVNFYESRLMAEIYAQALEAAGFQVDRHLGLGVRADMLASFQDAQVDLIPEYVGSSLVHFITSSDDPTVDALGQPPDGETTRTSLQTALDTLGIPASVLAITPGLDINTTVVRPETAEELGLSTLSDLVAVQDQLRWGLPPECDTQAACFEALEAYGITYPPAQREALAACDSPMADALANGAIDVAWLCSTQPPIAQYGFVVLADDLGMQPADHIAPIVRNDWADQAGGVDAIAAILDPISAQLTTEVLTELGVRHVIDLVDIPDVAAEFLAGGVSDGADASAAPASPAAEPAASPAG
jgi:osmoprotectant transport system substrate-binding protein